MTWQAEAPCVGHTELFFPGQGNHTYTEAEAMCATCPVFAQCEADRAEYETEIWLIHGYRAGKDPEHRRQLHRDEHGRHSGSRKVLARQALAWTIEGKMTHEIAALIGMSKRNVSRLVNDARAELAQCG